MSSTIGSLLRVTQAYCTQLCEKLTIDNGICYYATDYPTLSDTNQFREVVTGEHTSWETIYEQADLCFTQQNLSCLRWAPAVGQMTDRLAEFLTTKGFSQTTYTAMQLTQWGELDKSDDVRIIPARALRKALGDLVRRECKGEQLHQAAARAAAAEARMDDPAYDTFLAIMDGEVIGRCSLFQVGDIACVMEFHVIPTSKVSDAEHALLAHVLALAKRLALRTICTQIEVGNPRNDLFKQAGFERQGEWVEFHRLAPS